MEHGEFKIGMEFEASEIGWVFRCTDIGARTICAIRIDSVKVAGTHPIILNREQAEQAGWFNGPPYAVAEIVFDENDMPICQPVGAKT
jgi:hypothetical protein